MVKKLEFQWLKTFITAANYLNYRQTAEALYISQPSVTVHIRHLEKALATTLFKKEGRSMRLTKAGKQFLPYAKQILASFEDGKKALSHYTQGYTSSLSIGISPIIADTILPFALKNYMRKHPFVEVAVHVLESEEMEKALFEEDIDIGLSCNLPNSREVQYQILYSEDVKLIIAHDGKDAESAPPLEEEDILFHHLLITDNHPIYWSKLKNDLHYQYAFIKTMKVSQIHISKRFIIEGLGVSYLPLSTVRRELMEGWLLEVPQSKITLPQAHTYAWMKKENNQQMDFMKYLQNYRL